jgi:23S rRNA pseudouridine2605 synthase
MKKKTDETPNLQPESDSPALEAARITEIEDPSKAATETEPAVEAVVETEVEDAAEEVPEAEEAEEEAENEAETEAEAEDGPEPEPEESSEPDADAEPEFSSKPRPPAKLERLQKILAAAGVASRRRAEELIEQGRVQVNGKIVTELGTKADSGRDHIRVDGKLLQGAERLRYFILNKPKGFVTTVKDPEGRPTVMQFFDKMKERLYPVGRLDYMSEGLLVVTNDGDLANRLTKASSGVEKTYLVKVAGQPTEAELNILRVGVSIERGKPGSAPVRTSPARIRQVRQGDNPWYEVVLIEGRNRELRKMFEEVGHFVEKIRRVGYGPLVLDQEPGHLRELEPAELEALRKAAEGKLRTPKSKELRRRNLLDSQLPTVAPKPSGRPRMAKPLAPLPDAAERPSEYQPKKFGSDRPVRGTGSFGKSAADRPFRPVRTSAEEFRPAAPRPSAPYSDRGPARTDDRPRRATGAAPTRFGSARPAARPDWKKDDRRPTRPPARFAEGSTGESRPSAGRPFTAKPAWKKPERTERTDRPAYKRPSAPRREARVFDEDLGPVRPPNLQIEEIPAEQPGQARPFQARPSAPRSSSGRFSSSRPSSPRPYSDRSGPDRPRPSFERPASSARPAAAKPFRGEGGLARPFTTSSGKPRAGGARPSSKPGRPFKPGSTRPYGSAPSARTGSGPRSGADSRPSYGAKRPYGAKPTGHSSTGSAKPSFRRAEGEGSFAPRPYRPAADSSARPSRPYTPRAESASSYRPTKEKPYPSSTSRAERKAGPDWKPKPNFGGPGKPASGSHSRPKPGGFSKSGYKGKPTGSGAKRTGFRPGGKPGGKKRS